MLIEQGLQSRFVRPLVRKMPALEELRLEAHRVDTRKLFGLALPRLRGDLEAWYP